MKKILLLAFLLLVAFGTSTALAEEITTAEGFVFETTTGAIVGYTGTGGDIVIPNELDGVAVTAIGDSAFLNCDSITGITFANSITTIGAYAFKWCDGLINVVIPDNVEVLGNNAFEYCYNLESVSLGNGITSINSRTFRLCTSLVSVSYSDDLTYLGSYAFSSCYALENITIPSGVSIIGLEAFYHCTSLTSVVIPSNVKEIRFRAFRFCTGITSLTIEEGVEYIGSDAFQSTSIESLTIPSTVHTIGSGAFRNTDITSLAIPNTVTTIGSYTFAENEFLTTVEIPTAATIGTRVFYNCDNLTSFTVGAGVTNIPESMFSDCDGLINLTIPSQILSIDDNAFENCNSLQNINFEYGIQSIGDWAFKVCDRIGTLTFPSSLESIGNSSFYGCSSLTDITFSGGTVSLDTGVFSYCTLLSSVDLNGVINIPNSAFDNCDDLQNIVISEGVTSIGDNAFYDCDELLTVDAPDSLLTIGNSAFKFCSRLISFDIGHNVTAIGSEAFYSCGITYFTIGDKVDNIGADAFAGSALTTLTVIGNLGIFDNTYGLDSCNNLTEVIFESGVAYIHTEAFRYNDSLESVTLPDTITTVGDSTFRGCTALENVSIPEGTTEIGSYAFYGCNLSSLDIPSSVTIIGSHAYGLNNSLTSIYIPSTVESLGTAVFIGCDNIISANIDATNIGGGVFNSAKSLESLTIGDNVETIGTQAFDNCPLVDVTFRSGNMTIGIAAFRNCTRLASITIPSGVTSIGDKVFQGCSNLKDITLSEGLISIGNEAFSLCDSLVSIEIPDSVTNILEGAFKECSNLETVIIGSNIAGISRHAFTYCDVLKKVYIYGSNPSIALYAYSGNSKITFYGYTGSTVETYANANDKFTFVALESSHLFAFDEATQTITGYTGTGGSFAIPHTIDGVEVLAIAGSVFSGMTSITNVSMPDTITTIGSEVFSGCTGLKTVDLSSSLESIPEKAFINCKSLRKAIIPKNVVYIGSKAFKNCINLKFVKMEIEMHTFADNEIFTNCPNLVVECYKKSKAHEYCKENNISVELLYEKLQDGSVSMGYYSGVDILQGDLVLFSVDIVDAPVCLDVEYVLAYWLPHPDYSGYGWWIQASDPMIYNETIGTNFFVVKVPYYANDTENMDFAVFAKTKGDPKANYFRSTNTERINIYSRYPLTAVNLTTTTSIEYENLLYDADEVVVTLGAIATDFFGLPSQDAEYCFQYRVDTESAWVNIDGGFKQRNMVEFMASESGNHEFRVLARAQGRGGIDALDESSLNLSIESRPIQSITINNPEAEYYNTGAGVTISASSVDGDGNPGTDETVEYKFFYSIDNGTTWVKFAGWCGHETMFVPTEDGEYIFKAKARAIGSTTVLISSLSTASVMHVQAKPIQSITINNPEAEYYNAGAGVTISASSVDGDGNPGTDETVEYKFFYSIDNGTTWVKFAGWCGHETMFVPTEDGEYIFKAKARAIGSTTVLISSLSTASVMHVQAKPIQSITINNPEAEYYNAGAGVTISASSVDGDGNPGTDETVEYKFFYSIDNGTTWVKFAGWCGHETMFVPTEDGEYIFKAKARAIGSTTVLISSLSTASVMHVQAKPIQSITINNPEAEYYNAGAGVTISASSVDGDGNPGTDETVEYKFFYSIDNGTTWVKFAGWCGHETMFVPTEDGEYIFKAKARAIGSTTVLISSLSTASVMHVQAKPIQSITINNPEAEYYNAGAGVTISASSVDGDGNPGTDETVEYKFFYSIDNGTTWTPVAITWGGHEIAFTPTIDGDYVFYAKARAIGSSVKLNSATSTSSTIHLDSREIIGATLANPSTEYYGAKKGITLNASSQLEGGEAGTDSAVQYKFVYSIDNGITWIPVAITWGGHEIVFTPPEDGEYLFRVKARAIGGNIILVDDADNTSRIYLNPEAQTSVELDHISSPIDVGLEGVEISATATGSDTAEYLFYYQMVGENTWYMIGDGYSTEDSVTFYSSISGDYRFIVQVRTVGRDGYDAYDLSDAITINAIAASREIKGYVVKEVDPECLQEIPDGLLDSERN